MYIITNVAKAHENSTILQDDNGSRCPSHSPAGENSLPQRKSTVLIHPATNVVRTHENSTIPRLQDGETITLYEPLHNTSAG